MILAPLLWKSPTRNPKKVLEFKSSWRDITTTDTDDKCINKFKMASQVKVSDNDASTANATRLKSLVKQRAGRDNAPTPDHRSPIPGRQVEQISR